MLPDHTLADAAPLFAFEFIKANNRDAAQWFVPATGLLSHAPLLEQQV
jgi:hypothetical protein